jgi:ubiquinone/menaquinone biosynthesis C-methylase UbiE
MEDRQMAEWWKEAFDDTYLHIYARLDRSADESARHIVDRLALPPGVEILDLCGGYGRVAIPLARRGTRAAIRMRWRHQVRRSGPQDRRQSAFQSHHDRN